MCHCSSILLVRKVRNKRGVGGFGTWTHLRTSRRTAEVCHYRRSVKESCRVAGYYCSRFFLLSPSEAPCFFFFFRFLGSGELRPTPSRTTLDADGPCQIEQRAASYCYSWTWPLHLAPAGRATVPFPDSSFLSVSAVVVAVFGIERGTRSRFWSTLITVVPA